MNESHPHLLYEPPEHSFTSRELLVFMIKVALIGWFSSAVVYVGMVLCQS